MTLFTLSGIILAAVSVMGYINYRWVKLPDVIGMTAIGLMLSLVAIAAGTFVPSVRAVADAILSHVVFPEMVFHGLLGLLLFAGGMHVDFAKLNTQKLPVILLATLGVVISTLVVGAGAYALVLAFGMQIPLSVCLLFGALISPTDPIAVLSIMHKIGTPPSTETKIVGESLFNDGTGVVVFVVILAIVTGTSDPTLVGVATLLFREIVGGVVFGLGVGYIGYRMLRAVDSYAIEVTTTLAMAIGGYALAEALHVSAPLSVVVMGLFIGNHGVKVAMSQKTQDHLLPFWELLDELLNLVLFAMIGIVMISLTFDYTYVVAGMVTIPLVLLARFVSVWIPLTISGRTLAPHAVKILTWGGLRGGISVALALSLPQVPGRELIIAVTYAVVLFSLLIQATTLGNFVRRLNNAN